MRNVSSRIAAVDVGKGKLPRVTRMPMLGSWIFDSVAGRYKYLHAERRYPLQHGAIPVYRARGTVSGHFSRIQRGIRRRSPPVRPRNVRFVLCAIAERTIATRSPAARSRQIAGPPVQRSIDREQRSTHGAPGCICACGRVSIWLRFHRCGSRCRASKTDGTRQRGAPMEERNA